MAATPEKQRAGARERQRRHRAGENAPPVRRVYLKVAVATPPLTGPACARPGQDPDLWFSEQPEDQALAQAICATCPARRACHVKAEANGERFGVWAGDDRGQRVARRGAA
jgi:WhiB family transcriptional regulator, redox-sensing transcriptional regulator